MALPRPLDDKKKGKATGEATIVDKDSQISDFDARLALAQSLAYSNHLNEALREYSLLLAANPGAGAVRRERAEILVRLQRWEEALKDFQAVLAATPRDNRALLAVGRIYLWQGRHAEAAEIFNKLIRQGEKDPALYIDLARAYSWGKQYEQSLAMYQKALARMGEISGDLFIEVGDVYLYAGNINDAARMYRQALLMETDSLKAQKKLGLVLSWLGQDDEAMVYLTNIHARTPEDEEAGIELARVYVRKGKTRQARDTLRDLLKRNPRKPEILVALADTEAALGHATACRGIYLDLLNISGRRKDLLLRYAGQMPLWGDFYGAEMIYRQALQENPADTGLWLNLAGIYAASQRYEEGEGIYRRLLRQDTRMTKALAGLAELKLLEKDFAEALIQADRLLAVKADDPRGRLLRGDALAGLKRYQEAVATYETVGDDPSLQVEGYLRAGKLFLNQGDAERAHASIERAGKNSPQRPAVRFYLAGQKQVQEEGFVADLINKSKDNPKVLDTWGGLYATGGLPDQALSCYQAALAADPAYMPARTALAEILGAKMQYQASLDQYQALLADFPESSQLLIGRARVLSWGKRYQESIDLYKGVSKLNPADPVPVREMARVALWDKRYNEAMQAYDALLTPPVDNRLRAALSALSPGSDNLLLSQSVQELRKKADSGAIYEGYEELAKASIAASKGNLSQKDMDWEAVEGLLVDNLPLYRIQKGTDLEKRGKTLSWNKRFTRSLGAYESLLSFSPGNEEAWFDYAQTQCALGLCEQEGKTYREILHIDPFHSLAQEALERQQIRSHPALQATHWYWKEEGWGDLARITRNKTDLNMDVPFFCNYHLRLTGHHWEEKPDYTGTSYGADGFSLAANGMINPYVKGDIRWTHKVYRDALFQARDTGQAQLSFNLRDAARIGVGYERTDELYNYFGIRQGAQADQGWISAMSNLTRKLEVNGQLRYLRYNDDNDAKRVTVSGAYAITDHPRLFKVILSGEYRDTGKVNQYIYNNTGQLTDIIHPYWAPQNYYGTALTLEWYHDLSKNFYCGSELHFYDLRVTVGADTIGNPSVEAAGEWHYEFLKHWMVGVTGMIHQSSQWKAQSLWGTLKYQF